MTAMTKVTMIFSGVVILLLLVALCVVLMTQRNSSRSGSLKGSMNQQNNITMDLTGNNTSENSLGICLVSMIEIEVEKDDTYDENNNDDDVMLICNPVSGESHSGVTDSILYLNNVERQIVTENQKSMLNHEWFIEYSHDWIQQGQANQIIRTIQIPTNQSVTTLKPSNVPLHPSVAPHHRRTLREKLEERRRKLQVTLGVRTVVVVAVNYQDDLTELHDHVFGDSNSLVTQMQACSQGQLFIQPHPVHPIIQVYSPQDIATYTFVDLYAAVLENIKVQLGLYNGEEITDTTDHILLMVPDSITRAPGELGWGATPGFFAGIIHSLAPSTMTYVLLQHAQCTTPKA